MIENIGFNSRIHPSVEFLGLNSLSIGDNVEIGENVRFFGGGDVRIGDYTKIFRDCLFIARNSISIGQVSWIGEKVTIDGTGLFSAGNFLGVGIGSALYSHIQHGDVTEGSKYDRRGELIIGEDVWFVGECLVSPIVAEDKSMAMLGSVVIKNMKKNHIYGGNPAVDITEKVGNPWQEKSVDEKINRINCLIDDGCKQNNLQREQFVVVENLPEKMDSSITYYSLTSRSYTKRNTPEEIKLNKWLFSSKARFKKHEN